MFLNLKRKQNIIAVKNAIYYYDIQRTFHICRQYPIQNIPSKAPHQQYFWWCKRSNIFISFLFSFYIFKSTCFSYLTQVFNLFDLHSATAILSDDIVTTAGKKLKSSVCPMIVNSHWVPQTGETFAVMRPKIFVTLDHKTSLKSLGYICSNSQKYIAWVKMIDFSYMQKIIRILCKDHVP